MRVLNRVCGPLLLLIALLDNQAAAKDFFATNRRAVLDKIRPHLIEVGFNPSELMGKCGKPLNLKYCRYPLLDGLEFFIVETHSDKVSLDNFLKGADGAIYELDVQLSTANRPAEPTKSFRKLCAGAILAIRTKLSRAGADLLVEKLIQKALMRKDDPAQARDSDSFSTVAIDLSRDAVDRCRVIAEDDYLSPSGAYKRGEDIP